jgi:hypothetical protein
MVERFSNEPTTTLAAGITASATSLTVSSSAGFPAANFRVRIDNEILLVTAVAGTIWTVTRAVESTTAAAHAVLATVAHVLTAGGLTQALLEAGAAAVTTLVAGSGSNLTTTSATLVDLDASMNTSYVSSGGVLVVLVIATVANDTTGGQWTGLGVSINGVDTSGTSYSPSTANFRGAAIAIGRAAGLAAGTYTIKPRFRTSTGGTTTALTVGSERFMLILEL